MTRSLALGASQAVQTIVCVGAVPIAFYRAIYVQELKKDKA